MPGVCIDVLKTRRRERILARRRSPANPFALTHMRDVAAAQSLGS